MLKALCWLLLPLSAAVTFAQSWSPQLTAGGWHHDNATRSIRQQKADSAVTLGATLQQVRVLSRDWQASMELGAQSEFWRQYSGLNLSQISARAGLRRKFGLGPYAPKLDLSLEGFHQIANVSAWSGNGYRAAASLQKRFTPQWSGSLRGDVSRFDAQRYVYAGTAATMTAGLDYDLTPAWRVSARVRYGQGDQLSWCRESFPEFIGKGPQWKDGIFGGDWFPYQSEGNHRGGQLSIDRALGVHSALSLGYDYAEFRAPKDHFYRHHLVRLSFTRAL